MRSPQPPKSHLHKRESEPKVKNFSVPFWSGKWDVWLVSQETGALSTGFSHRRTPTDVRVDNPSGLDEWYKREYFV